MKRSAIEKEIEKVYHGLHPDFCSVAFSLGRIFCFFENGLMMWNTHICKTETPTGYGYDYGTGSHPKTTFF